MSAIRPKRDAALKRRRRFAVMVWGASEKVRRGWRWRDLLRGQGRRGRVHGR